ncbi:hypothetical protein Forpe1208_v001464 [Fusarium oxysporum f. sp. rapae]|uniref:Uncharacterized protein n=1 Tax=Fusarium oxysporum f. sp. rapae TaxID=485398 RepID=A0A8J5PMN8_FUSOX|nr:hypothetical protein Forpe1208_v001464 [Fusarium oxysporum f. sp. rapae]
MGAEPPCKPPKTIQEPEKNDALWLLKGYIDLRLPDGGDFWTGNKEDFLQGTDDVAGFIDFLKLPENCQHPLHSMVVRLTSLERKSSAQLVQLAFIPTKCESSAEQRTHVCDAERRLSQKMCCFHSWS